MSIRIEERPVYSRNQIVIVLEEKVHGNTYKLTHEINMSVSHGWACYFTGKITVHLIKDKIADNLASMVPSTDAKKIRKAVLAQLPDTYDLELT